MKKKLYKSNKNKMLCGVCGGFADFLGWDPTLVRFIFVALGLLKGVGVILYIVATIIMPSQKVEDIIIEDPEVHDEDETTEVKKINGKTKTKRGNKVAPETKNLHTDEEFDSYFKE